MTLHVWRRNSITNSRMTPVYKWNWKGTIHWGVFLRHIEINAESVWKKITPARVQRREKAMHIYCICLHILKQNMRNVMCAYMGWILLRSCGGRRYLFFLLAQAFPSHPYFRRFSLSYHSSTVYYYSVTMPHLRTPQLLESDFQMTWKVHQAKAVGNPYCKCSPLLVHRIQFYSYLSIYLFIFQIYTSPILMEALGGYLAIHGH